jgi:hypothetical protein
VVVKGKRGRPRKAIVQHTLSPDLNSQDYQSYKELYYTDNNEMVGIGKIEDRIRKADLAINKNIAQTALDIYFVKANWKTFYSRNKDDQFNAWLQKTIPFSRSYVWDLMKCVKELVAFQSGNDKAKELDDLMLASVQQVFKKYDISLLRDVIHLPKAVKGDYISQLMNPDTLLDKAVIKAEKAKHKVEPKMPLQNVIIDHVLKVNDKAVLSLEALAAEDSVLTVEVEKAIERAYRKYKKVQGKN